MNSLKNLLILLILIIFATSSCTVTKDVVNNSFIQKRKYNKGFFVKNTKSKETAKHYNKDVVINDSSNESIEEKQTITEPEIEERQTTNEQELLVSKESEIIAKPKLKSRIEIPSYFNGVNFIKARKKLRKINIEPDDEDELKYDIVSIIGLGIIATFLPVLFITTLIMMSASYMMWGVFLLYLLSIFLIFCGFVVSIFAMIRQALYEDKYKGFLFAFLGFILPLITLFIYKVLEFAQ